MAHRADAAKSLHHSGGLPVGAALDKSLKAAELDDMQTGRVYSTFGIHYYSHLAVTLNTGYRIDDHLFHRFFNKICYAHQRSSPSSVILDQFIGQIGLFA